ncbi:C-type lectin domain family 4 member F-like [Entelurus aequoreus]|uniref:C-type lectin domain family 4 member F-like n=1 Tax=Entelurus aequoreus TaxID=161455 RepID=UPI002B1E822C|nr:C-type lectin domain family 4 member F-like [Entelurus aequoreus]
MSAASKRVGCLTGLLVTDLILLLCVVVGIFKINWKLDQVQNQLVANDDFVQHISFFLSERQRFLCAHQDFVRQYKQFEPALKLPENMQEDEPQNRMPVERRMDASLNAMQLFLKAHLLELSQQERRLDAILRAILLEQQQVIATLNSDEEHTQTVLSQRLTAAEKNTRRKTRVSEQEDIKGLQDNSVVLSSSLSALLHRTENTQEEIGHLRQDYDNAGECVFTCRGLLDAVQKVLGLQRQLGQQMTQISADTTKQGDQLSSLNDTSDKSKQQPCDCCADGWEPHSINCYKIVNNSLPMLKAKQDCEAQGAQLPQVEDRAEQKFISRFIYNAKLITEEVEKNLDDRQKTKGISAWIGLGDDKNEGHFKWLDGQNLTEPIFWRIGEPNNFKNKYGKDQDCVVILPPDDMVTDEFEKWKDTQFNTWDDLACKNKRYYLCKRIRAKDT